MDVDRGGLARLEQGVHERPFPPTEMLLGGQLYDSGRRDQIKSADFLA
jgi:hypothetical protein